MSVQATSEEERWMDSINRTELPGKGSLNLVWEQVNGQTSVFSGHYMVIYKFCLTLGLEQALGTKSFCPPVIQI